MINSNGKAPAIRSSLHDSIHMIHREDWMVIAKNASPYLQYDHLLALEDAMDGTMDFKYGIHYCEENQPMGITYFQVAELVDNGSTYRNGVQKLGKGIGGRIIKEMKVRCLVSGNVFHCGDHGSHFLAEVSDEHRLFVVEDTMRRLDKGCYFKQRASVSIVKDIWQSQFEGAGTLEEKGFAPLNTEVNMVMSIDPEWTDLDAYQHALNAKARTRMKSIMNRSKALLVNDLDTATVKANTDRLQGLFDQVLERSPFTFGRMNVGVYDSWKTLWKKNLVIRGYHLDGELVGFATAFVLGDTLDVQYVGIDHDRNIEHGIYQRMLVDLLEVAITRGLRNIFFGRTAEQAKSNLGAVPADMRFYVKHRNALANKLVGPFLRSIEPAPFEQRAPFKAVVA